MLFCKDGKYIKVTRKWFGMYFNSLENWCITPASMGFMGGTSSQMIHSIIRALDCGTTNKSRIQICFGMIQRLKNHLQWHEKSNCFHQWIEVLVLVGKDVPPNSHQRQRKHIKVKRNFLWMNHKFSWIISFGQKTPQWRFHWMKHCGGGVMIWAIYPTAVKQC